MQGHTPIQPECISYLHILSDERAYAYPTIVYIIWSCMCSFRFFCLENLELWVVLPTSPTWEVRNTRTLIKWFQTVTEHLIKAYTAYKLWYSVHSSQFTDSASTTAHTDTDAVRHKHLALVLLQQAPGCESDATCFRAIHSPPGDCHHSGSDPCTMLTCCMLLIITLCVPFVHHSMLWTRCAFALLDWTVALAT